MSTASPPHDAQHRSPQYESPPVRTADTLLAAAQRAGADRLDAQLLLLHAWGRSDPGATGRQRAWLLAHGDAPVPEAVAEQFLALIDRRVGGEPCAYLMGSREFFGLDLAVDPRVLIPRPDTELLVEWALEVLVAEPAGTAGTPRHVLDLGTGSGAIALALKHRLPALQVDAVDASAEALAVAQTNARALGLDVRFLQGDWLGPASGCYACIISNPPYVAAQDPHLTALRHEPLRALIAGADGLRDLRIIIGTAGTHLHAGGWLIVEHGYDQGPAVRALFADAGFTQVGTRRDLAGHERCTGGRVIGGKPPPMVK